MNDSKYFVIAIGGTGMRCLESFVHLCAVGLFDDKEINVLTLDTDAQNGNKERTESLIHLYSSIKRKKGSSEEGHPNHNTFFSARLNLYSFYTSFGDKDKARDNYVNLSSVPNQEDSLKQDNEDLSDLFLEKDSVQQFDLAHGFRAQTHLGSMLMYHGIIEAARNVSLNKNTASKQDCELIEFLDKMAEAGKQARVFIFGSVFGGTGASSIPILPMAFKQAVAIQGKFSLNFQEMKFATTLLTQYFTFASPDEKQRKAEKGIVADAKLFPVNSQAALQFYQNDATVKECYRSLYHVGWPFGTSDYTNVSDTKTVTGGNEQKNACHVVELLCASAAFDFFNRKESELSNVDAQYYFHGVEQIPGTQTYNFTGNTFVGGSGNEHLADVFTNKLGAFLSFAHVILSKHQAAFDEDIHGTKAFIDFLNQNEDIKNKYHYETGLEIEEMDQIDKYMRQFAYSVVNSKLRRGWIYQIFDSLKGSNFIFKKDAFESDPVRLRSKDFDPGNIFVEEAHNWPTESGIIGIGGETSYNKLITILKTKAEPKEQEQHLTTIKEKFLAHLYNAITIAQKFV